MTEQSKPKVTLEKLLQLKRCEKPSQEFWEDFDKKLQSKTLMALVEKPSLWARLPRLLLKAGMVAFPVGATAALSFALLQQSGGYFAEPSSSSQLTVQQVGGSAVLDTTQTESWSSLPATPLEWDATSALFVMDAMPSTRMDENRTFRAVMHTPLMSSGALTSQGTVYVVNPLHRSDNSVRTTPSNF